MAEPTMADILIDNIPVQPEDKSTWLDRFSAFIRGGGPWGTAQPGQRGTWVPSQINAQGNPELAVPGVIQQPAESLQSLMTAPLADIVRSGDRDAIRAAAEASFDVAGALPAAGSMIGAAAKTRPTGRAVQDSPPASAPRQSADMGAPHTVADYEYPRAPFQEDWPTRTPYGRTARPYHGQDMAFTDHRGIWPAESGVPGAQVLKYQDMPARMRTLGQDPVPGVRGIDGRALYSNPDDPTTAAAAAALTAQERPKGIKAYHGSPHDFDKFDLSKIGTGEGAQAYGHGLYFAENEGVARSYRDALGGSRFADGSSFDDANPAHQAAAYIAGTKSKAEAISALNDDIAMSQRQNDGAHAQRLMRARGMLERGEPIPELKNGRMYEVSINANPEDFIDWDKPLSQQMKAFDAIYPDGYVGAKDGITNDPAGALLSREGKLREDAARALRDAGIPGIRYLDQGSRSAGEGSRNYVVFDPDLIDILRKYSNAPDPTTAAILALLGQQGDTPHGLPTTKGARPEPDALVPKTEAMGVSQPSTAAAREGLIAETPQSLREYISQVKDRVDDGEEGPFYGPRTGKDDAAVAAAYERGFKRELDDRSGRFDDWEYDDAGNRTSSPYVEAAEMYGDASTGRYAPYVAAGLEDAAQAAGRELYLSRANSGSVYGALRTPAGNSYKVRVADHGKTSAMHDAPAFNIAPGRMTPEEFIKLLPTIYSSPADPTTAAILALLAAQQGGQQQQ